MSNNSGGMGFWGIVGAIIVALLLFFVFQYQMTRETKNNISFLFILASVYGVNRLWLREAISHPIIGYILKCHFNDYLAGIAIIAYINLVLSLSKYHEKMITTYFKGFIITSLCGIIWEYILPKVLPHGTSDFFDVISYVLGGITYIWLIRAQQFYNITGEKINHEKKHYQIFSFRSSAGIGNVCTVQLQRKIYKCKIWSMYVVRWLWLCQLL